MGTAGISPTAQALTVSLQRTRMIAVPKSPRRLDVERGIKKGFQFAAGLAIIATVILLVAAVSGKAPPTGAFTIWGRSLLFYLVAGAAGGALYGFLRPIQNRYFGRLLTAYLIVFMVYGGASVAIALLLEPTNAPIRGVLVLSAVLSLLLAPAYEAIARRFW